MPLFPPLPAGAHVPECGLSISNHVAAVLCYNQIEPQLEHSSLMPHISVAYL